MNPGPASGLSLTNVSVVLMLAALAGWWLLEVLRRRFAAGFAATRLGVLLWNAARALLVVVALAAHLNVFEKVPGALVALLPGTHYHETFHYYLGTRYFAEVGYTGLYHAAVLADYEDDRASYAPAGMIRDLASNRLVPRTTARQQASEVRRAFSPERWQAFKREVAVHREASEPGEWEQITLDHGYNGTPVTTALLAGIGAQPWLSTDRFLRWVGFLDVALLWLFCVYVGVREGAALALGVLFFSYTNALNDFHFIGGSYLRYAYFLTLAAALLALRRGGLAASGVLLAVSGWMRIFPLAIYGALLLRDLAHRDWRQRLASGRRLHISFAVASVLLFGGTSLLDTPDGRNPWLAFADNLRVHAGAPGVNVVHLGVPLLYSPARDRLHEMPDSGSQLRATGTREWAVETLRVRSERAWWARAAALVLLGLAFAALRRASRTAAVLPALLVIFSVLPMTHYYWALLSLLPLVLPPGSRLLTALLLLFAALALTSARDLLVGHLDLRFALLSLEVLAFLVFGCVTVWRGRDGEPAAAS